MAFELEIMWERERFVTRKIKDNGASKKWKTEKGWCIIEWNEWMNERRKRI